MAQDDWYNQAVSGAPTQDTFLKAGETLAG